MKKENQNSTTSSTVTATDLKSLIHNYSFFFDNLVQLIPAKFYLPSDEPKPWFQGLSKSAKAAAKHQSRENTKNSRRLRLDPENPQSSTLVSLKYRIETEKQKLENDDDEQGKIKPIGNLDGGDDRSVTYEELRQRLHRRIEEIRGNRRTGETFRSERRERRENQQKRKRGNEVEEKSEKVEVEEDVSEAAKGIEFGKVKLGGEEERERRKKKRKVWKSEELERAKKDPEVGKKYSWKAAVSRAAGVKVHDDPRLLKQSAQKERRRHEKSAEKWKERVESREKVKGEKQQKRSENIAERIRQKKMRKIAKREKKLMRPGFEGRKEGYINQD